MATPPARVNTVPAYVDGKGTSDDQNEAQSRQRAATVNAGPIRGRQRGLTQSHRKVVLSDPVAFRYLEEDESTIVLDRWAKLTGYELYIVEQWVCSRTHPTFIITTYTGDPSNTILVNVLAVPNDESKWSKRLKIYFQAVSEFHAREHETRLGTLMLTNLSGFPSSLSVIFVPDGDVKKHREDFIVNENLKRLGCSGRAAMTLQEPPASTAAKFHHLYQTSETISFRASVIALVKACQQALVLYGKLEQVYADGLLCDITERAVGDWWDAIGIDFHNVEPSDGILGPSTVSALLGLLTGAYSRLKAAGIAVGKDPLDLEDMKRSVGSFQKAYKINRSRRLDRETLDKLHRATAKYASGEGWAVPKAVKSTVAELSGKGGEMVMGIVGARGEKTAISEAETLDVDRLAQLVQGPRLKWLWQGKPMKGASDLLRNKSDDLAGKVFSTDEDGQYLWTSPGREFRSESSNTDFPGEVKSSVKKLRHAVGIPGLRSHHSRLQKHDEETIEGDEWGSDEQRTGRSSKEHERPPGQLLRTPTSIKKSLEREWSKKPALNLALAVEDAASSLSSRTSTNLQSVRTAAGELSRDALPSHRKQLRAITRKVSESPGKKRAREQMKDLRSEIKADVYQKFATEFDEQEPEAPDLRRSKSALQISELEKGLGRLLILPRRFSFSFIEDATLRRVTLDEALDTSRAGTDEATSRRGWNKLASQEAQARQLKELTGDLLQLEHLVLPFADAEVSKVEKLEADTREHLAELNNYYFAKLDEYQSSHATSSDLVGREKSALNESLRRMEGLAAKLDYELDALQSKMQEVEESTTDFERSVREIEARVSTLMDEKASVAEPPNEASRVSWLQQVLNFTGAKR